jgi:AraC-like DNA-binding protein
MARHPAEHRRTGVRQLAAGRDNILARMSELMFVEAVRRYIEALPAAETGWLAGLRDPVVGQGLAALHAEPASPWTVESLARRVGVSRSVLADRFTGWSGSRRCSTSRSGACSSRRASCSKANR